MERLLKSSVWGLLLEDALVDQVEILSPSLPRGDVSEQERGY